MIYSIHTRTRALLLVSLFLTTLGINTKPAHATLKLMDQNSDISTFDKIGNIVIIRQCKYPALEKAIQSPTGCPIKEGTVEARFELPAFMEQIKQMLPWIQSEVATLSTTQKQLLSDALENTAPYNDIAEFNKFQHQLSRKRAFSKEERDDYNVEELAAMEEIDRKLSAYFNAQTTLAADFNSTIEAMESGVEGSIIRETMRNSSDHDKVKYHALKRIADLHTNPPMQNCGATPNTTLAERIAQCEATNKFKASVSRNKEIWHLVTWFNGHIIWQGPSKKIYTAYFGVDPHTPGTLEWVNAHCSAIPTYVPDAYHIQGIRWQAPESTTLISDFTDGKKLPIGQVADWIWLSNRTRWKNGEVIDHSGYAGALCQGI